MSDYVTLVGAEQVQSAGYRMHEAAVEMRCAASAIQTALLQHQQFLSEWLNLLTDLLRPAPTEPSDG